MTKLEKLEQELDKAAMVYGELWQKVKRKRHPERLDLLDKEMAVIKAAQDLYLARRKAHKV